MSKDLAFKAKLKSGLILSFIKAERTLIKINTYSSMKP